MPKLDSNVAKNVETAEEVGFKILPPGVYAAKLESVESRSTREHGFPAWNITFGNLVDRDGNKHPGKQFLWINIPQDPNVVPSSYTKGAEKWKQAQNLSMGRLKQFFDAFGVDPDTDTDELIGQPVAIKVGVQTAQSGPRKGEDQNQVNAVLPFSEVGDVDFESDGDSDTDF